MIADLLPPLLMKTLRRVVGWDYWCIILRFTNRCHFFCNISLLYVSTLHVSGLYQPIIKGIPSCCYLLPLGSCGAWLMSACVWVFRCEQTTAGVSSVSLAVCCCSRLFPHLPCHFPCLCQHILEVAQ